VARRAPSEKYLVLPFCDRDLGLALDQISSAHQILRRAIEGFLKNLAVPDSPHWACEMKRLRVTITAAETCQILRASKWDYFEIVIQCAKIERLMDAMKWARDNLPEYGRVKWCNPAQSNVGGWI
jgi:hypothetical protein